MDFDEFEDDDSNTKEYGDYAAQWDPGKGLMHFVRIKGKGPLPGLLDGSFTGLKFTDEAHARLLASGHRVDKRTKADKIERKEMTIAKELVDA
tara:strand:+ start:2391 stop:2669 length:279 start_codon:yes stop_codon:yes gene_type:complete